MSAARLLYLVAGEPSGDLLGARLMAALRRADPTIAFAGVGGPRMAEQGLESLFPYGELALMGLAEVLPALSRILRRLKETREDILARRPAGLVTIDVPGFTLRLAAQVRGHGFPVIHYVAPQVWAWRQSRVKKIARRIDHLLLLLPFERAFFDRHGIATSFVGHPVIESGADPGDGARFRAAHGIEPGQRVLLMLPGSRRGEVERLMPVFGETLRLLAADRPDLAPVIPTVPHVAPLVRARAEGWPVAPLILERAEDKPDAYATAAAALTKSGTSTLELAIAGVPMAVAYRVNAVTAMIARRLIKVRFAALVNLLAEREVVPEFIQEQCVPDRLAPAMAALLDDPAVAGAQRSAFAAIASMLRPEGMPPSEAAAAAVLRVLAEWPHGGDGPAVRG